MPALRASSRTAKLKAYLAVRSCKAIGEAEWEHLRREFPEIGENSLRRRLWDAGFEIQQPWCGVRTTSLIELELCLVDLERVYASHPEQRAICRKPVIEAKNRTRFASRNSRVDAGKRAIKDEMVRWMLVWLEDPAMFEAWVRRRKEVLCISR